MGFSTHRLLAFCHISTVMHHPLSFHQNRQIQSGSAFLLLLKCNFKPMSWPPTLACSCAGVCQELSNQCFMMTILLSPVHSQWGLTSVFEGASHTLGLQGSLSILVLYCSLPINVWTSQLKIFGNFQSLLDSMPKPLVGQKWSSWEGLTIFHSTSDTDNTTPYP